MDRSAIAVIEGEATQVAGQQLQTSAARGCSVVALHLDVQIARAVQQAVAAVVVIVEIVPYPEGVG